jgi:hypothetical protein
VPFVEPNRAAAISALGKKRTSKQVEEMSAIPPKADIGGRFEFAVYDQSAP